MTDRLPDDAISPDHADESGPGAVPETPRARWEPIGTKALARRGQGAVWRVRDRDNPSAGPYVLKEMRYSHGPTSLAYRRFVREIAVMTRLSGSHHGIVPVVARGIPAAGDEWQPFYVMPAAESSLERARDLTGSVEAVLAIGIQIANALEAAHAKGVIHRDVKPGNILLFGDQRLPALADFGICHLQDDDRLTGVDAQTVGSRDYVAPELQGGGPREAVSVRADIYSLGKTLYAVAAGRDPFPREEHHDAEWNLSTRFSDRRFDHLHGLLTRMVTKDVGARFRSMQECREALERALEAVRRDRPYVAGMYGGDRVPLGRYGRALASIAKLDGRQRDDAFIALVEESERAADEVVRRTTPARSEGEHARNLLPGDEELTAECAEHLLIPAMVALTLGIDAPLEDWHGSVVYLARVRDDHTRRGAILSSAAAGALYAFAAVAWRRRRWEILKTIVATFVEYPKFAVYLKIADGHSGTSARWLADFIAESSLVGEIEPSLSDSADGVLGIVSGRALLRDFINTPDANLEEMVGEGQTIHGDEFAGLYPDYREWLAALPEACLRSPAIGRGVASVLGAPSIEALRPIVRRVTPALVRWVAQVGRRSMRDTFWVSTIGKEGPWARWMADGGSG